MGKRQPSRERDDDPFGFDTPEAEGDAAGPEPGERDVDFSDPLAAELAYLASRQALREERWEARERGRWGQLKADEDRAARGRSEQARKAGLLAWSKQRDDCEDRDEYVLKLARDIVERKKPPQREWTCHSLARKVREEVERDKFERQERRGYSEATIRKLVLPRIWKEIFLPETIKTDRS